MTASTIFSIANMLALPMWLLMILLPKWKVTRSLMDYKVIPLLLAVGYAFYIFKSIAAGGGMDFSSLDSVMNLFTQEDAVLAGWIHYLAFDLLVGMWMLNLNLKLNISQILMAICLFATFMLGPIGFLLFTIIRTFKKSNNYE